MLLPYDDKPGVTSGIRLGTPIVTKNGMGAAEMDQITNIVDAVLQGVEVSSQTEYRINARLKSEVRNEAAELCRRFHRKSQR